MRLQPNFEERFLLQRRPAQDDAYGAGSQATLWNALFGNLFLQRLVVRYHRTYRRYLFNPSQCGELPEGLHLGVLQQDRTTVVIYEDGRKETLEDYWEVNELAERSPTPGQAKPGSR